MKNEPYNKGDIIKINHTYTGTPCFWAVVIGITPNYFLSESKIIAYKRMDNNQYSFTSENYITEVKPPIPNQAPINEYTGEQR